MMTDRDVQYALDAAYDVVELLEKSIPGYKGRVMQLSYGASIDARYRCPCGEVSGQSVVISGVEARMHRNLANELAVELRISLREHIRSEGFEPTF